MIYGALSAPDTHGCLLSRPAWKTAFDWLRTVTPAIPAGVQQIQGDDIYVNVHGYDTLPAPQCRYESHRRYLDLQYCISGGELIDWQLASDLLPDGPCNSKKDLQFYRPQESLAKGGATLQMAPGRFAIFFPSDAHAPKRADGIHPSVFKLVIKLDHRLVL